MRKKVTKRMLTVFLCSIFVVLSSLDMTSYANVSTFESQDGEIFICAGEAIYSSYAQKANVGTYTLDDGTSRVVDVYRLLREKDKQGNNPVAGTEECKKYCISVNVYAPNDGSYTMETVSSKIDSTAYSPYEVTVNVGDALTAEQIGDSNVTLTTGSSSQFYKYSFGKINLKKGNNTIVFKPTARTSAQTYSLGLAYIKLLPAQIETVNIDVDDASRSMHGDFVRDKDRSYTDSETNVSYNAPHFRLRSTAEYDSTEPYFVRYSFNSPVSGYYNLSVIASAPNSYVSGYTIYVDDTLLKTVDKNATGYSKKIGGDTGLAVWDLQIYLTAGEHNLKFENIKKREMGAGTDITGYHNFRFCKASIEYDGSVGTAACTDEHEYSGKGNTDYFIEETGSNRAVELTDGTTVDTAFFRLRSNSVWNEGDNLYVSYTLNAPEAGLYKIKLYANGSSGGMYYSDYTVKINGVQIAVIDKNFTDFNTLAENNKLAEISLGAVALNKGANTITFDGINTITKRPSGYEDNKAYMHKFHYYKTEFEKESEVTEKHRFEKDSAQAYAVCRDNRYGVAESGNDTPMYDAYITGNIISRAERNGNITVILAEYRTDENGVKTLINTEYKRIPVTKAESFKTITYEIYAENFEHTVTDGNVDFTNTVKLYIWDDTAADGIYPYFEAQEL